LIRTIVTGVSGRMGNQMVRAVRDADGLRLVGATERPGTPAIGLDAGLVAHLGMMEVPVTDDLAKAIQAAGKVDVVIDFTHFEASVTHAEICAQHGIGLVVGSTGFSSAARASLQLFAERIPVVMSPNMSVGVNLMIQVAAQLAEVLGPTYDVEILELHHRQKVDAPSGTAVRLAEVIAARLGRNPQRDIFTAREGQVGERPPDQIGIQSLRGGDTVGEHTVLFLGQGERLELTHRATSRDQFANGAVRAARWLVGRPPGLYSMQDVLGL
jgi:4-hydroxy-tetrahydrodipicolinate reductase